MLDPAMIYAHQVIDHEARFGDRAPMTRYIAMRTNVERKIVPPLSLIEKFGYTVETFLVAQQEGLARFEAEHPEIKAAFDAFRRPRPPSPPQDTL